MGVAERNRPKSMYDYPQVYERLGMRLGHFGCIMLDVEPIDVTGILGTDRWYYSSGRDELRYVRGPVAEKVAHCTLLYGLTPGDNAGHEQRESVDELLDGLDLTSVTVSHVSYFPGQMGEPYSCVIAHLDSGGDLLEANRRLRFLPHIDSFVDYRAHVTLAYVRQEHTDRAVNALNDALAGEELTAVGINYGGELKG